jgi:protein-L-isoaspartate O-methyltransferase
MPRHKFVPAWWEHDGVTAWQRRDADTTPEAPYEDRTLITQAGTSHADHAAPGDKAEGPPTSSATKPSLTVNMYRHAMITDHLDVLDIGTGTGYGAALLTARLGNQHVTSMDVDPYLVVAATGRLDDIGLSPALRIADATAPLDGQWDRIISTMSVAPVPASWLTALSPGGRIVTTIAGTGLLITADRTPDGSATGKAEWYRAGFMASRTGTGYPPPLMDQHPEARHADGDQISYGRYPVVNVASAWELRSMLGITLPGTESHYEAHDGQRTAWLIHPDGSWARAAARGDEPPQISQAGPRRLWDHLDSLRTQWLSQGGLTAYGSDITITPDGSITFTWGKWHATIPATRWRPPSPGPCPGDPQ